ncbi:uncharacterized protein IUM83_17496 [Phytophthora cinnamomi]|uniref:uncharacterized protein n=1 Tax=Phytophthora cinnamomi TaxID=4785 RepID=UPI003559FA78|nr:hypothetical protein IUM83_17496 [Phytophthora cinnamomi]
MYGGSTSAPALSSAIRRRQLVASTDKQICDRMTLSRQANKRKRPKVRVDRTRTGVLEVAALFEATTKHQCCN